MGHPHQIRHVFYNHPFPTEFDSDLARLYQSIFSVRESWDGNGKDGGAKKAALAIYGEGNEPLHILCYSVAGRGITLLNELLSIEPEYLQYLAEVLFARYPEVHTINLNRITSPIGKIDLHTRVWNSSCDIVVPLPATLEEYRARLGKHTKSNMNNYCNKLKKEQKDFSFDVVAAGDVDPAVVSRLIEMNRSRMESKEVRSAFDSALVARTQALARSYGLVATIRVNGEIAAGTVCYEVGDQCYAEIIAHDPAYSRYSIGQVCIYLTIKALIERGRVAFHMLWGENDYKFRFLGERHDIYFMSIYRSKLHKSLGALTGFGRSRYWELAKGLRDQCVRTVKARLAGRAKQGVGT